jgi:lipoprotein-releasing system permease protein
LNTGFNTVQLNPIGVFNTQQENDNTLCLAAMDSVQKLLGRPNQCSFVGIDVQNGASISRLKSDIEASLGEDFKVEDIEEQNATLFRILKVEKLSVFIILSFIALIAIVNIMSSLIMLIIEKQKDNAILQSLGASQSFLSKLYFTEGMLIVFLASVLGLVLGGLFSLGQQHFGWITAVSGDGLFEIPYPCVVQMGDFISILLVNIVMASLVVWIAIRFSLHKMKHLTSLNSV